MKEEQHTHACLFTCFFYFQDHGLGQYTDNKNPSKVMSMHGMGSPFFLVLGLGGGEIQP